MLINLAEKIDRNLNMKQLREVISSIFVLGKDQFQSLSKNLS